MTIASGRALTVFSSSAAGPWVTYRLPAAAQRLRDACDGMGAFLRFRLHA
jgi:hypothetical protein